MVGWWKRLLLRKVCLQSLLTHWIRSSGPYNSSDRVTFSVPHMHSHTRTYTRSLHPTSPTLPLQKSHSPVQKGGPLNRNVGPTTLLSKFIKDGFQTTQDLCHTQFPTPASFIGLLLFSFRPFRHLIFPRFRSKVTTPWFVRFWVRGPRYYWRTRSHYKCYDLRTIPSPRLFNSAYDRSYGHKSRDWGPQTVYRGPHV